MNKYDAMINGRSAREVQGWTSVINPATEEVVGHFPECSELSLEEAVSAARDAFLTWSKVPDETRVSALNSMADFIEANAEELANLLTQEQGKPLKGLGSEYEVQGCVGWLRATAAMNLPVKVLEDSGEREALLFRKPVGVVASITPWNWPLMIAIWHLAPAIRTGCTVVVKPASNTPLSTLRMIAILNEALPPGVLNIVTGDVGHQLTSHPGVDKVVFTGSTPVGRIVMSQASQSLKRLTLELGGNDAGLVLDDADVGAIAESLFWGAFINNGQTCAALKRLYVHESKYDEVCSALSEIASTMPMGNGLDEGNIFGPVQNKKQYDYVCELVDDAKVQGAKVLVGGNPKGGKGFFYPLTVVADISDGTRLVDEEQFGPVLPIIKYNDLDEAIGRANNSSMGLGGSVWSSNMDRAKSVAQQLECGSVWINGHGQVLPHVPFGGVKQSGLGVEFGIEGLEEYTTTQSMHIPR